MIEIRILWAAFLAALIGFSFHRSWKIEHGRGESLMGNRNEAIVWTTPLVFPFLIFAFLIIDIVLDGMAEGLSNFIKLGLDIFLTMSIYFVILLVLLPLLRRHFSARACATLWMFPVALFYQPFMLTDNAYVPLHTFYIPGSVLQIFVYIWLIGFAVLLTAQITSNFLFRYKLLKAAEPIKNDRILEIWEEERKRIRYKRSIRLLACKDTATPLSMGMFQKTCITLLPERNYTSEELRFIFRHELHHIQRRDVDTKVFLEFCRAMCWFNPLVWIAVSRASDDLELSCDEIVLEGASDRERQQYANLLLHTAGRSRGFTTCLSATARSLRYRLKNVMRPSNQKYGIALLAVIMFICCISYGSFVIASDRGTVGSLVLTDTAVNDVAELHYDNGQNDDLDTTTACSAELLSYLKELKVDKLLSSNQLYEEELPELSCEVIKGKESLYLSINKKYLRVDRSNVNRVTYYILRTEFDEAYVKSFF